MELAGRCLILVCALPLFEKIMGALIPFYNEKIILLLGPSGAFAALRARAGAAAGRGTFLDEARRERRRIPSIFAGDLVKSALAALKEQAEQPVRLLVQVPGARFAGSRGPGAGPAERMAAATGEHLCAGDVCVQPSARAGTCKNRERLRGAMADVSCKFCARVLGRAGELRPAGAGRDLQRDVP